MDEEMANYRQIHVSIWKDEWFLELEPDEKLLFIYLFSNESTSLAGIYKLAFRVICFETGLSEKSVKDAMKKFAKADKAYYEDGIVWIVKMRKYHATKSPKVQTRIAEDVLSIPDTPIKIRYLETNIPYGYPMDTSPQLKEEEKEDNIYDWVESKSTEPAPREPLTASEYKNRIEKATIKSGESSQGMSAEVSNYLAGVPEHVRSLAREFCKYKERPPTKKEDSYWRKAWADQYEIGLKPESIARAIEKMNKDGLTIKSPESVTAIAEDLQTNKTSQSPQATELWTSEGQVY